MKPKTKRAKPPAPKPAFGPANVKRILVPVDFSDPSLQAVRCAAAFAQHLHARVTLLHVVEPMATPDLEYLPMAYNVDRIIKLAERKLRVLSKPEGQEPALVEQTLVRTGKPFREITEAARELASDLIIISTHGYTGLERALLGSTAERVVRHAPCPVLTLHQAE